MGKSKGREDAPSNERLVEALDEAIASTKNPKHRVVLRQYRNLLEPYEPTEPEGSKAPRPRPRGEEVAAARAEREGGDA